MNVLGYLQYQSIFVRDSQMIEVLVLQGIGAKRLHDDTVPSKSEVELIDNDESTQLLLLDEEAMYLVMQGHMTVIDSSSTNVLTTEQLWSIMVAKSDQFPANYKVYSHLKDLGYIVKSGTHYGVSFTAYRSVPVVCHSEICIVVRDHHRMEMNNQMDDEISWRRLSTLTRVMPDVMKLLVIFYVMPKTFWGSAWESSLSLANGGSSVLPSAADDALTEVPELLKPSSWFQSILSWFSGTVNPTPIQTDFRSEHVSELGAPSTEAMSMESKFRLRRERELELLFGGSSFDIDDDATITDQFPACLDLMAVWPVTSVVRRAQAKSDIYQTVSDLQKKYRSVSILQRKRQEKSTKKKQRQRRDITQIRAKSDKALTKKQFVWKHLGDASSNTDNKNSYVSCGVREANSNITLLSDPPMAPPNSLTAAPYTNNAKRQRGSGNEPTSGARKSPSIPPVKKVKQVILTPAEAAAATRAKAIAAVQAANDAAVASSNC